MRPDTSREGGPTRIPAQSTARRKYLFLGARLGALAVWATSLVASPVFSAPRGELRFEHLTAEDGLSQASVSAILQDQRGFLWVGTADGLNRFDGYTFRHFTHRPFDSASIANSWIRCLLEDRWGQLWIGTHGGGLDRFDPDTESFTHYPPEPDDPEALADGDVRALAQDQEGNLWIGTWGGGLHRMDAETGRIERFGHRDNDATSLGSDQVRTLLVARDGTLWVGTFGGGLQRYVEATRSFVAFDSGFDDSEALASDDIVDLFEDSSQRIWISTRNEGVRLLDPRSGELGALQHDPGNARSLSSDRVIAVHQDRGGTMWVATLEGLNRFDAQTSEFERFVHDPTNSNSLSNDQVTAIYEDRSEVLWFGTWSGGLNKHIRATQAFATYRHVPSEPLSLGDNQVWSLLEDHRGTLWVGTNSSLDALDSKTGRFTHFVHDPKRPDSIGPGAVTSIHEDDERRLWVATDGGGLNRVDRRGRFVHYRHDPDDPASLSSDRVRSVASGGGELWVATFDGALNRLDLGNERFTLHRPESESEGSLGDAVQTLFFDRDEKLWVGSQGSGLYRFDAGSNRFDSYRHRPSDTSSISSNRINALWQDASGTLWIGTDGGLNSLETAGGDFRHWTEAEGLAASSIYTILGDSGDRLWLGTSRGLIRLDPRTRTVVVYDVRDGLQGREFNAGAAAKGADGRLYVGGNNGLTGFDPAMLRPNPYPPPVVVTSFKKYNRVQDLRFGDLQELELSYRDDLVSFEFAALDYRSPAENQYSVRLEGFDDDWVQLGTKRDMTYTDLKSGSYVLRIRGTNNDGLWNEEGASLAIEVQPAFWEILWVQLLAAGALLALVLDQIRRRTRRIEDQNRRLRAEIIQRRRFEAEREELISDLEASHAEMEQFTYTVSHDLKSPLVTIRGFLGLVEKDALRGDKVRLQRDIERIGFAVETMSRLLGDLLQVSQVGRVPDNPERLSVTELANQAAELIRGRTEALQTRVVVPQDLPEAVVDPRRFLTVFQNLLDNAVKFASNTAPLVEVGAVQRDGELVCWVRDNGIGIEPQYQEKVFGLFERLDAQTEGTGVGLALVKRIVESRGGRVWVESKGEGTGSTFYFTIVEIATDPLPASAANP